MAGDKYNISLTPRGYNSKIAPDLLPSVSPGTWLVRGSQNCLIAEDGTTESRGGSIQVGTGSDIGGVFWADTWLTNTGHERAMRTLNDVLQVLYDDEWKDVKVGFGNLVNFCGGSWWNKEQSMDTYVFVNGSANMYSWQGGIADIATRVLSTSFTKTNGATPTGKEVLITAPGDTTPTMTFGYPENIENPQGYTALRGTNGIGSFWDAGFRAGDIVSVTITAIAGSYTIQSINQATNEMIMTTNFVTNGSSTTVGQGVVCTTNAYGSSATTFQQERFAVPEFVGTFTVTIASPGVFTYANHGLQVGDRVFFTTTGALPTGLSQSTHYYVISAGLTANTFEVSATSGGSAINTSGTQSGVHSWYRTNGMGFTMLGVSYTYTGGYFTDTLTGIVPNLPGSITAGTPVFSEVTTSVPTGGDYSTGATPDVMAVSKNQVYLADSDRNWVWISKQDDYNNFAYTVPLRVFGEGGSARLDKKVVALITNDQDNSVRVSCGRDSWYPISLVSSTNETTNTEEIRVGTPQRGTGVGANNQFAACNTKQGIMYLSQEPTFDYLQNVEQLNQVTTPIGHDIENDLQIENTINAKTIFWRNYVWLLLPAAGKLYAYDMQRRFWQPPQTFDANCMSIIDDWLVLHSAIKNQSYRVFDGTNDLGNPISILGIMSYTNGGTRERFKMMDGFFVEARVSPGTDNVKWGINLGYKGSGGSLVSTFGSQDGPPFVQKPAIVPGIGGSSIGQSSIGSLFIDEDDAFYKVRRIFPVIKNQNEFLEYQTYFQCDKLDAQFKIICQGDNAELAGTHNSIFIKI